MIYNGECERLRHLQIVDEAYFGRTPEVEQIIQQIGIIRKKAGVEVGEPANRFKKYNPTINTWPEMIQLNRMIEDMFGFEAAGVYISQNAAMNACTYPISYSTDVMFLKNPRKMITSSKTGFKYKKEAKYCLWINITSGLFLNNEITDEEITAILFHEIGHNFSTAMDEMLGGLQIALIILNWIENIIKAIVKFDFSGVITGLASENWNKRFKVKFDKFANDFAIFKAINVANEAIYAFINMGNTVINDVLSALLAFNPIVSVASALASVINWPVQILKMFLGGTRDEQFADAFPGMYGLGAEVGTSLSKMESGNNGFVLQDVIYNTPVIGHIANAIQFPIVFMSRLFDEHPNLDQRFREEIELCEKELAKTNIDPKLRNEIKRQLEETKKAHKRCCDPAVRNEIGDPHILQRMYEDWLRNRAGGGARASIFDNDHIFNKIDDTYNKSKIDDVKFK